MVYCVYFLRTFAVYPKGEADGGLKAHFVPLRYSGDKARVWNRTRQGCGLGLCR